MLVTLGSRWKIECLEDGRYYPGEVTKLETGIVFFTYPPTLEFQESTEKIEVVKFAERAEIEVNTAPAGESRWMSSG